MDDWENWVEFYKVRFHLRGTQLKYKAEEGSAGIFKLQMLRAITQGGWGLPEVPKRASRGHYDKLVARLEQGGITGVTTKVLSNAKSRKLLVAAMPMTDRILPLLAWLVEEYPSVDLVQLFHPSQVQEAELAFNTYRQQVALLAA